MMLVLLQLLVGVLFVVAICRNVGRVVVVVRSMGSTIVDSLGRVLIRWCVGVCVWVDGAWCGH